MTRNNEQYDVQRQKRKTDHNVIGMGDSRAGARNCRAQLEDWWRGPTLYICKSQYCFV